MSRLLDVHNFLGEKLRWQLQVLHDRELSPTAKVIGCQLMHDLNVAKRGAWRSQAEIAELLAVNVRSVRRCIAELVRGGHLVTTPSKGRGHSIVYEALIKADNLSAIEAKKADNLSAFGGSKKADISCAEATERRTNPTRKADNGARPYLLRTHTPSIPPNRDDAHGMPGTFTSAVADPPHSLPGRWVAVPAELRERLLSEAGRDADWAGSYLDPCGINLDSGAIHSATGVARGKLTEFGVRKVLADAGFSIGEPVPLAQLQRLIRDTGGERSPGGAV